MLPASTMNRDSNQQDWASPGLVLSPMMSHNDESLSIRVFELWRMDNPRLSRTVTIKNDYSMASKAYSFENLTKTC